MFREFKNICQNNAQILIFQSSENVYFLEFTCGQINIDIGWVLDAKVVSLSLLIDCWLSQVAQKTKSSTTLCVKVLQLWSFIFRKRLSLFSSWLRVFHSKPDLEKYQQCQPKKVKVLNVRFSTMQLLNKVWQQTPNFTPPEKSNCAFENPF